MRSGVSRFFPFSYVGALVEGLIGKVEDNFNIEMHISKECMKFWIFEIYKVRIPFANIFVLAHENLLCPLEYLPRLFWKSILWSVEFDYLIYSLSKNRFSNTPKKDTKLEIKYWKCKNFYFFCIYFCCCYILFLCPRLTVNNFLLVILCCLWSKLLGRVGFIGWLKGEGYSILCTSPSITLLQK